MEYGGQQVIANVILALKTLYESKLVQNIVEKYIRREIEILRHTNILHLRFFNIVLVFECVGQGAKRAVSAALRERQVHEVTYIPPPPQQEPKNSLLGINGDQA
ncbi:hypothetical protein B0H19DRAFT_488535 [Mycena capillaripes]|nr:hypothetical protein B0H19DRAFT_488535 [Mycena capillaripes]